ncbi:MAG TPA: ribonuclease HII [Thermoplasmataceae archaeon]|nr:ribonuclease HII [Thermoplasmataceae archaeon]
MTSQPGRKSVACGIDEAGRGPVLGPMVISLVCADADVLRELRVRDSKTLSRSRRETLYTRILSVANRVEHTIISVEEINDLMNEKTLNEIELQFAVKLAGLADGEIVVDCFDVNENRASERMSRESGKTVRCIHKADRDYPAVSAASIVSKVIRDREIDRIKEKYGEIGSGYPADPVTRDFIERAMTQGLDISQIIRTHWDTVRQIREKVRTSKLY